MRFEDIKYDFPKMPEEMRAMIEREVEKQVKTEQLQLRKDRKVTGKILAASAAAVLMLGTTAFAGVSIYHMQRQQVADHGVKISIAENMNQTSGSKVSDTEPVKTSAVSNVKMNIGYLPDGMVQTEQGKYSFTDALYQGGISIVFYKMDTGDAQFEMLHGDVLSSEELTLNGNSGVYLEYPHLYEEDIVFNQRIYEAFADVHYVMEMYIASDVEKEEAVKIARSIQLVPTEDAADKDLVSGWNWSDYLAYKQAEFEGEGETDAAEFAVRDTVSREEMKNTHAIGDRFSMDIGNDEESDVKGLVAKVSSVQVSDDLSLLDPAQLNDDLREETGSDGKLLPAVIQYIKQGSADSLSEVVKSREAAQKLVYADVEYTNTGDKKLDDVLFMGSLARICEDGKQMHILSGFTYEEPGDQDEWTQAANRGLSQLFEMQYYDVHGGERKNNYIDCIQPGETVTVHMGWIVTEEELDKLYLSLDTYGGTYEFTDSALALGYVDLRQN